MPKDETGLSQAASGKDSFPAYGAMWLGRKKAMFQETRHLHVQSRIHKSGNEKYK
jgi:hypothetical protein